MSKRFARSVRRAEGNLGGGPRDDVFFQSSGGIGTPELARARPAARPLHTTHARCAYASSLPVMCGRCWILCVWDEMCHCNYIPSPPRISAELPFGIARRTPKLKSNSTIFFIQSACTPVQDEMSQKRVLALQMPPQLVLALRPSVGGNGEARSTGFKVCKHVAVCQTSSDFRQTTC